MNRTKIEWCDYTINPVKGLCPMACKNLEGYEYCYSAGKRGFYGRFKWNPEIRFIPEVYDDISVSPRGQRIFIGSTIELFGDWVRQEWLNFIIKECYVHPWHIFILLTKQPLNLTKWSPFPDNCWVGISTTTAEQYNKAQVAFDYIQAGVRFISCEPLLEHLPVSSYDFKGFKGPIDWVIIGSQTQPIKHPRREWVDEIIEVADRARIPVFIKEPLVSYIGIHRQEFPK